MKIVYILIFTVYFLHDNFLLCSELQKSGKAKRITIEQEYFRETIINCWNEISPSYLEHKKNDVHPGDLIEAPVFKNLINKYAKNAQIVLDAGSGNGWFTTSLLEWNILDQLTNIIGIDISPKMIATAQTQTSDSRAQFFCGSLDSDVYAKIGIKENSLDLIISSNALDCIQNIEEVLAKLNTFLKNGNFAIISIRHPLRNAFYLTGTLREEFEEGPYAEKWSGTGGNEVIRFYRKENTWDVLFKAYGFEIVEKNIPQITETVAKTHPEHYQYYKNKKHPVH